jgi:hypothetical protein
MGRFRRTRMPEHQACNRATRGARCANPATGMRGRPMTLRRYASRHPDRRRFKQRLRESGKCLSNPAFDHADRRCAARSRPRRSSPIRRPGCATHQRPSPLRLTGGYHRRAPRLCQRWEGEYAMIRGLAIGVKHRRRHHYCARATSGAGRWRRGAADGADGAPRPTCQPPPRDHGAAATGPDSSAAVRCR